MSGWPELAKDNAAHVHELLATIAELEDRIAAFEAHHEEKDALIIGLSRDAQRNAEDARAERQCREEAEATIRGIGWSLQFEPTSDAKDLAREYFSRYPSESPPSTTEAENE